MSLSYFCSAIKFNLPECWISGGKLDAYFSKFQFLCLNAFRILSHAPPILEIPNCNHCAEVVKRYFVSNSLKVFENSPETWAAKISLVILQEDQFDSASRVAPRMLPSILLELLHKTTLWKAVEGRGRKEGRNFCYKISKKFVKPMCKVIFFGKKWQ